MGSVSEYAVVGLSRRVDSEYLDMIGPVKVIGCPATGLDHIDLAECGRRGIKVLSLRDTDVLPRITATAEHTVGLILSLVRKIPVAANHVRGGGWDRTQFMGRELSEMVVGIIGYGRIGSMVSEMLAPFIRGQGAIEATSTMLGGNGDFPEPAGIFSLSELDIVTMHVDLNDTSRGMCNAAFFAAMKPGAYFVNTSRGQVVDEAALLASLRSGHLAGAALDVVCGEYDGINQELLAYANEHPDRLIITPHIGGYAKEAIELAEAAIEKRIQEELRVCDTCGKPATTVVRDAVESEPNNGYRRTFCPCPHLRYGCADHPVYPRIFERG